MVTIAVDAMGGDHAPGREVEGAIAAATEYGVRVLLVGKEDLVRRELARRPDARELPLEVVHASEVVTMEDAAAKSLLRKRDSSVRVAARLVKQGEAQGFLSAGNTGAVMATAKTVHGMIPGVDRPALASAMPTATGKRSILIDVGANVDCSPQMLVQFAVMGEIYSRVIFRAENPSVGLLSIGEEDHKGNEQTKAALPMLRSLPLNFVGNVEGRDVFSGAVDVIVCDGFVGNVVLKVSEGLADMVKQILRESFSASPSRKLGYLFSKPAFAEFRKLVDYSETGGAPLLGVKGVSIICHGSSNVNAIKNAIRIASEFAEGQVNALIEKGLRQWQESQLSAKAT